MPNSAEEQAGLSLQKKFFYEAMRRTVQQTQDVEGLRRECLKIIDYMEGQQQVVNRMLKQQWLGG